MDDFLAEQYDPTTPRNTKGSLASFRDISWIMSFLHLIALQARFSL
jgi:hypothetical protein